MGVDVEIKARPVGPTGLAEPLDTLREKFRATFAVEHDFDERRYPDLAWDDYDPVPTLEVRTLMRYYGPGYERGHWPDIKAMGDWLANTLGDSAEVRYGGDSADEWDELTPWPEARAECEAHWQAHANEPYRRAFER